MQWEGWRRQQRWMRQRVDLGGKGRQRVVLASKGRLRMDLVGEGRQRATEDGSGLQKGAPTVWMPGKVELEKKNNSPNHHLRRLGEEENSGSRLFSERGEENILER
ncbi:OLC1v1007138C1 [Oldenlandia corymbosa var. corymbosa]|uniref:OLC1v1007138C1 n=1 Tax=Oldenlandia corymbosa var. corymbosa TaxID=529605 RepID=A0AAV1DKZ2_OLDCO|nr:OLC1v1007138C1 [Oldenlandia corymbosa var. corymbosa]